MQQLNRKTLTRISALVLVMMLVLSYTASFAAASFASSKAGIEYGGKTFKLGKSYSTNTMKKYVKKAFGSYSRKSGGACTCGSFFKYVTKKGVTIETLQAKQGGKEKIVTITVTKKGVPTVSGLKVTDKISKAASLYGTKCGRIGNTVLYTAGKYNVYITKKNNKVSRIEFWYDY